MKMKSRTVSRKIQSAFKVWNSCNVITMLLNFLILVSVTNGCDGKFGHNRSRRSVEVEDVSDSIEKEVWCDIEDLDLESDDYYKCDGKCTKLHQAVLDGCLDEVSSVIEAYSQEIVNKVDEDEMSPLHIAAMRGDTEIAEMLLEDGAELQAMDGDLNTALHHAAWNGHWDISLLLIEKGIDINARNTHRATALHLAVLSENFNTVRGLLHFGSQILIDREDENGYTAERLATLLNNIPIMKLFRYRTDSTTPVDE